MPVPLLDLSEQYRALGDSIREAINDVLASGRFILGPKVEAFERAMCAYCNTPHAIGVSSGTDALLAILMALGIGRGDAVITTPYTFFATAGCIARVGARPLFADIDRETYNIRPSAIQECIEKNCQPDANGAWKTKSGEKLRAMIPVHLFGLCCEMEDLHKIAERYRLVLIEDAAQAIGAEFPFRERTAKAGTMGDGGLFSFYPSKNLGCAVVFSSRRRHTRLQGDWSSDVCSSDLSDLLTRTNLNWLFQREDTRYRRLSGNSLAAGGVDNAFNAVNCGGFATGCYTSSKTSQRLMGAGGGVGLEYKERYIADALVRRDGSSLFGSDNRWATYYRGSLAWRVAQEPAWPFKDQIDEFKLRVSRGTAGGRPSFVAQYETYTLGAGGLLTPTTLRPPPAGPPDTPNGRAHVSNPGTL